MSQMCHTSAAERGSRSHMYLHDPEAEARSYPEPVEVALVGLGRSHQTSSQARQKNGWSSSVAYCVQRSVAATAVDPVPEKCMLLVGGQPWTTA